MDEKTLKDLRDQRTKALQDADAITAQAERENRGLSDDEHTKVTAFLADADRLAKELEAADRARIARAAIDDARRQAVPDVAVGTPRETPPRSPVVDVKEHEARAYRKGDGLAAIVAARLSHDAHLQHVAVRDAERVYGSGSPQVRALQQSTFTAGGALIPENFVGAEFIEALRAESAFRRAGPRMVTLTNGSFTTPRLTGATSVTYLASEGDNLATSEPTFGSLVLTEKKVGVIVPFSNDLRRNASLDAIRVVTEDLVRTVAIDEDTQCFNGSGLVGLPKGIYNWIPAANRANQTGTTLANVRTDVRKMKNGLDNANVPYTRRTFFMHSRSMNYLGWDLVDGNSNFAFPSLQNAAGATLGGDPVYRDNVLSITGGGGANESQIFYVEMAECYLAEAMDMEIQIFENAAYSQSGTVRAGVSRDESVIRLIRKWDFGMRHTSSAFVIEAVTLGA